jgi:hypothetical protein
MIRVIDSFLSNCHVGIFLLTHDRSFIFGPSVAFGKTLSYLPFDLLAKYLDGNAFYLVDSSGFSYSTVVSFLCKLMKHATTW